MGMIGVPMTVDALRELADSLDVTPLRSSVAADAVRTGAVAHLRSWADDIEHAENGDVRCEGCSTWIAEGDDDTDSEGVELCPECWASLLADAST